MNFLETGKMTGEINLVHYAYDVRLDRTYVTATATVWWIEQSQFHLTDRFLINVKGSNAWFAKLNASTTAIYRNRKTGQCKYVYDYFREGYNSFQTVAFTIPVELLCGEEESDYILYSVQITYQAVASTKVSIIEVASMYEHQIITLENNFSIIAALTPSLPISNIQIVPTFTTSPSFAMKNIWRKVLLGDLYTGLVQMENYAGGVSGRTFTPLSSDIIPIIDR